VSLSEILCALYCKKNLSQGAQGLISRNDKNCINLKNTLNHYQMQFLLIAYDGTDTEAVKRRMKSRPEHLEKIAVVKKEGHFICGGAILDDSERMIGSMILYEVPDREALDKLLLEEPYIYNKVWEKIEIKPFRAAKIDTA
jgi:uncharacterized protein YciI